MLQINDLKPTFAEWPGKEEANLPTGLDPQPLLEPKGWWGKNFGFIFERRKYKTTIDYFTYVDEMGMWMWCPPNFVYDFASVPKILPISHDGILSYGALPHDFIYRFGGLLLSSGPGYDFHFIKIDKSLGDRILRTQNIKSTKSPVPKAVHWIAHGILRLAGWANYKPRDILKVDWSKPVYATEDS
jgi:hypothetical protein